MSEFPVEVQAIIDLLENGEVDEHLDAISSALTDRQFRVQDSLMKKVRKAFGPNARVVVDGELNPIPLPSPLERRNEQFEIDQDKNVIVATNSEPAPDGHLPPPSGWPTPITAVQGVGDSIFGGSQMTQGAEFGPAADSMDVDFGDVQ